MSRVLVTGSIVYDSIMNFEGRFKDHILPDKIHMLNVSFLVDELRKHFGGTAGNIAYNLSLLGLAPRIMATAGKDFWEYEDWLKLNKIDYGHIKVIHDEYTAQAYITTDQDDNQITAFHPGAMKFASKLSIRDLKDKPELIVVSPNDTLAMQKLCKEAHAMRIKILFDPGQQITALSSDALKECLSFADYIIVNDYELELITERTKLSQSQILESCKALIVTRGNQGSIIHTPTKSYKIFAFPATKIVDPTGCGDAYRAGIIYGLLAELDWETSGQIASLIASYKIASPGGQSHKFTLDEFKKQFKDWVGKEL